MTLKMEDTGRQYKVLFLRTMSYDPVCVNFSGQYSTLPQSINGHVVLRTQEHYDGVRIGGTVIHALPLVEKVAFLGTFLTIFRTIRKALQLHSLHKLDIIHCYDPLALGVAGVVIKKMTNARLIIEINGHLLRAGFLGEMNLSKYFKRMAYSIIIDYCLSKADYVKLLNNAMLQEHKEHLDPDRTFVFPDYVPTSAFSLSDTDENYIFFAGYPYFLKGVDLLIKAFLNLTDDFPEYCLIILGYNPDDLEVYEKMAAGCSRIQFHKPVHYDKISDYFKNCTIFVLPSRTEAMGRVLIEAMACGKPVIGARVGGIPEVIDHEINGLLFDAENVKDLEGSIRRLLVNPGFRRKLGLNGYNKVKREFSSEVYNKTFASFISMALKES